MRLRSVLPGASLTAGTVLAIALAAYSPQQMVPAAQAQDANVAEVNAGRDVFTTNCSFCHGADARGGAEGGPDLTKSTIMNDDQAGHELGAFLKVGRPPRMPAFSLPEKQVSDIAAYLHSQIAITRRTGASDPRIILLGDAKAGQQYFQAHCTQCHSLTGDLKSIGSKYDPIILQGRIAVPKGFGASQYFGPKADKRFPPEKPRSVTISYPGKPPITGDIIDITIFDVTYRDSAGELHTIARNEDTPKVVITDPAQPHIDMLPNLGSRNLHDLTAYLVTVK